jgi:hypothetical protein
MSIHQSVRYTLAALFTISLLAAPSTLTITTLSSMPGFVSGDDALVQIKGVAPTQKVEVKLNGRDVSQAFHNASQDGAQRRALVGLVGGLKLGANTLIAKAGSQTAKLELTNHPITGPMVAGEHLTPFVCKTEEAGLGKPLDADCSAPTKIEYFYRSTDGKFNPLPGPMARPADVAQTTTSEGKTVPYIVRVESGTINRAIYRIAILDDPSHASSPWTPSAGWNHRLYYSFGGGCGAQYNQGTLAATAVLTDGPLSRGYAHITSTQNVLQQFCNDALSGEAVMMIKEHFIKTYGVPEWTVGSGGSGGSIQQLLIGQNYPGLLDGLMPSLTFPDSASIAPDVNECTLFENYFKEKGAGWSKEKQSAVEGYSVGTCGAWARSFAATIIATNVKGCAIAPELVYDPIKNPKGARCTTYDTNVASYGRDEKGFARWPLDSIGVQYGLKALNDGAITQKEFIDLNRNIGGFDHDGNPRAERTVANLEAVRLAYTTGRIDSGVGGLPSVPILHYRSYNDAMGDIHDRVRDLVVRERLRKANGRFDNEVIWIYPNGNRQLAVKVSSDALDTMAKWLDGINANKNSLGHAIDKVVNAKPAAAVDGCWTADGTRINEPAVFGETGKCNDLYPIHSTPRIVAGTPLSDDVMKCQLKPVSAKDYKVAFTAPELDELRQIFPTGVCDYSKPGVMQQPLRGTYQVLPLRESLAAHTSGGGGAR